jgi:hypothetical protein
MRGHGIDRLRAVVYWNDDEGHLEEEIEVWQTGSKSPQPVEWDMDEIDGLDDLLWELDEYGIFEFDAVEHTVAQVGEAWIPEPELTKKIYDLPQNVVAIDLDSPMLPLVEYMNRGPFDDALATLWTELSQVPVEVASVWPYKVKIAKKFLTWNAGTQVDVIIKWFEEAAPNRFRTTYNK